MKRLSLNILRAVLLAGLGSLVFASANYSLVARAETKPATKLTQASPPSSTSEKKQTPSASPSQSAPAPATAQTKGPGWAVNCKSEAKEKELECRMSQTVVLKQSGQILTNITFRIPADTKKPEIIVQLPLGVFLAAGATVQVDENPPQRINYRACDRSGCFAITPAHPGDARCSEEGEADQSRISEFGREANYGTPVPGRVR